MALLGTRMHNTFAEAVDDCLICVMSRTDLERMILSKPRVALRILEITGKRLREAEERLENMAFKGIPARLASLLLRLSEEQESETITGLTHQDLAESVGTYRETATQVLNDLKSQGLDRNRAQADHDSGRGCAVGGGRELELERPFRLRRLPIGQLAE